MFSLCSADVDVVVNLAGADGISADAVLAIQKVVGVSSMDNSDLFVAMCLPGTFSPDNEGICHDCQGCQANQYEKIECIPTRDRTCANCTLCGSHEIELCQCSIKTSQCITGDRVCIKVPPTVVTLVVDFSSNGILTTKQQIFVRSGLAVGYTDWLAAQFDVNPDSVELTDFIRTGDITYKAYFRFNEVYGEAKIAMIQGQNHDFFQGGIYYTFGGGARRRRLLQNGAGIGTGLLIADNVSISCNVSTNCSSDPFTEFQFTGNSSCTGACVPYPCPPGYSGSPKKCVPCEPGTYKNQSAYADCLPCVAGYTSPIGANSSEACTPLYANMTTTPYAVETTNSTPSTTQPTQSSSSPRATSPQLSSSPSAQTSSSSAALQPWSSPSPATSTLSTAQLTASQAGSSPSSAPSAASSSTGQAPPQTTQAPAPPPPGWTGQTTGSTSGTGSGFLSSGSVVNNNNNNNVNNVNVNLPAISISLPPSLQPAPAPPPVYVTLTPQQLPPAPAPIIRPVFNNYFSPPGPPAPAPAPAKPPERMPHEHHNNYWWEGDGNSAFLLIVFFALIASFTLCIVYATSDPPYYQYQPIPQHRVRYRIPRVDRDGEGDSVNV